MSEGSPFILHNSNHDPKYEFLNSVVGVGVGDNLSFISFINSTFTLMVNKDG